jgi:hypothetical protein
MELMEPRWPGYVVPVKVTRNVAVDDVFKYFTDNRCQGYGSVI